MFIATTTKKTVNLLGEGDGVAWVVVCMLPRFLLKKWCNLVHLKCILIKFKGKYNLKISMYIATTTKKTIRKKLFVYIVIETTLRHIIVAVV